MTEQQLPPSPPTYPPPPPAKKPMNKKIIAIILAVIVVAAIIGAISSAGSKNTSKNETKTTTTTEKPQTTETTQEKTTEVQTPTLDHFEIATISSPQTVGTPFSITITAKDTKGNTYTSFTGTVILSDSTGTITPKTSGNFSGGVWAGNVTITGEWNGNRISATASDKTGASIAFNINPAPTPTPQPTTSPTVYITNTGKKYHRDGCQYLSKSKISISLADAKAQGYTP